MNWKLIFRLSILGLVMAFATVYFIPFNIEPFCWLVIFAFCAYMIATHTTTARVLHGFLVSIVNSVWITATHILLFSRYIVQHPQEANFAANSPFPTHPRLVMLIMGPMFGIGFGIILGLFSFAAGKFIKGSTVPKPRAMGQSA